MKVASTVLYHSFQSISSIIKLVTSFVHLFNKPTLILVKAAT